MRELALIAFAAFAVLDWVAVARQSKPLEFLAKPATLAALILWASTWGPAARLPVALSFSLLGDVFLMLPETFFAAGLGAFLVTHLLYITLFHASLGARVLWWLAVLLFFSPIAFRIMQSIQAPSQAALDPRRLRAAVVAYALVLSLMLGSALASGPMLASVGAVLFFASDLMIGWTRFVGSFRAARLAIIVTYHLGQFAIVAGLCSGWLAR